jgi:single-stranded DNA-binding protein
VFASKQAENAAEYLGKGSHVNIVGRLRNNNYQDADGKDVYGLAFICEEIEAWPLPRAATTGRSHATFSSIASATTASTSARCVPPTSSASLSTKPGASTHARSSKL